MSDTEKLALDREKLELDKLKLAFDRERHLRDRWWHEDLLVNQRYTWLLSTQALLGAGYGYLKQRIATGNAQGKELATLKAIAEGAPLFSIMICFIIFIGIQSAVIAQRELQSANPSIMLGVTAKTTYGGHLTARLSAGLFVVAWLAIWFALP